MSKLIVSECNPSVYQQGVATKNMNVVAIRPHLYIHGSPTGTIKVEIQDENGFMIDESETLDLTDPRFKTLAYAHGYYRFNLASTLIKDVAYRVAVVCGGGYTFSDSAFVGVCLDWDGTKQEVGYTPGNSFEYPLDFEIWERKIK